MSKIIISSDSTCDLTPEIIEKYNIKICPISIIVDGKEYHDTVDINAEQVIAHVKQSGVLPKTSAIGQVTYEEYFTSLKTDDDDKILHFCISSKSSSCVNQARLAAETVGGVTVIDSYSLSSGQGIQIVRAAQMLADGKSLDETVEYVEQNKTKVQISFVVDTLDFLRKGGRCSSLTLVASKVFKIHPSITMTDGALTVKKKYTGSMQRALTQYVYDLAAEYKNYDDSLVFITHSPSDKELVEDVKAIVKAEFDFKNIIETEAGSTVTSHCGYNTIGVIFYTK